MLPDYDTRGSMIVDRLGQLEKNALLREQAKQAAIQSEYAKPLTEANINQKTAEAARQNALLQQPFAGKSIPGAGGEALGLEMLKNQYGEDSEVYQNAKNSYDLQNKKVNQLMNYQNALAESLPKRTASPLAKLQMEESDIESGFMPGSTVSGEGTKVTPEKQVEMLNRYRLKQIKDVTDPKMRERALYATNMEKTINTLNPSSLVAYAGPQGRAQMIEDIAQSTLQGKDVPRYKAYKEALTSAKTLGKQVRQFYGDSIQPEVYQQTMELANPSNWYEQPDVALARYNQFVKILGSEADTFFDSLQSPDVYKKPEKPSTAKEAIKKGADEFKSETIRMIGPNGKAYNVPQGKAQLFVDNGYKRG